MDEGRPSLVNRITTPIKFATGFVASTIKGLVPGTQDAQQPAAPSSKAPS
jgi:hypothetical protein